MSFNTTTVCVITIDDEECELLSWCKSRIIQHIKFVVKSRDGGSDVNFSTSELNCYSQIEDDKVDGLTEMIIMITSKDSGDITLSPGITFQITNTSQNHNYNITITLIKINKQYTAGEFIIHSYEKKD